MDEIKLSGETWRDNTPVLQKALDDLGGRGGGVLYVATTAEGAEIGAISLPEYVTLHVKSGSTLLAAYEEAAYDGARNLCLIESHGTRGIGITGRGVIDGRALDFMEEDLTYIYKPKAFRARLIGFIGCQDILVRDITLRNSSMWTLHLVGCRRVNIDGITIDNDLKVPNCDGIDPDHCQDVRISNCAISCADDCIVIKNTRQHTQYGPTKRITVTGCTMVSTSAAVKIGTESVDDFSDITITGCTITDSSRGIALQLRDQGDMERIIISDCTITTRFFEGHYWGQAEPLSITALHRFSVEGEAIPEWNRENKVGTIRHVTISNIRTRGENGMVLYGLAREDGSVTVEDIRISNFDLKMENTSKWPAGRRDLRPCDAMGPDFRNPDEDPGFQPLPNSAVSIEGTSRVTLDNVGITWKVGGVEGYGSPIYVKDNSGLKLNGLQIEDKY